jgi:hypothetical protein
VWREGPGDLKASADRVFCEGGNHFVWHTWTHKPPERSQVEREAAGYHLDAALCGRLHGSVAGGGNELTVEITNTWLNRLVGDARLPAERRLTRTNTPASGGRQWSALEPVESGLFGPVRKERISQRLNHRIGQMTTAAGNPSCR